MRNRAKVALVLAAIVLAVSGAALFGRLTGAKGETLVTWSMDRPGFGGWSGLEVSEDGTQVWAITDSGTITRGELGRENGVLASITAVSPHWIKGPGHQEKHGFLARDSEGLARSSAGKLYVSYEGHHRVEVHDDWQASAEVLPGNPAFDDFGFNSGLEALAVAPNGILHAVAEGSLLRPGPVRIYALHAEGWQTVARIETSWPWLAVGADFGPDGRFYLLERLFAGVGFASRVRVFDDLSGQGDTAFRSPIGRYSNLEGLAVWRDDAGRTRLTMVSDDNYLPIFRTHFVEVVLPNGVATTPTKS